MLVPAQSEPLQVPRARASKPDAENTMPVYLNDLLGRSPPKNAPIAAVRTIGPEKIPGAALLHESTHRCHMSHGAKRSTEPLYPCSNSPTRALGSPQVLLSRPMSAPGRLPSLRPRLRGRCEAAPAARSHQHACQAMTGAKASRAAPLRRSPTRRSSSHRRQPSIRERSRPRSPQPSPRPPPRPDPSTRRAPSSCCSRSSCSGTPAACSTFSMGESKC